MIKKTDLINSLKVLTEIKIQDVYSSQDSEKIDSILKSIGEKSATRRHFKNKSTHWMQLLTKREKQKLGLI